jgi:cytochrome c553
VRGLALSLALIASSAVHAADAARAQEIVSGQCFVCHGADGEGSSPLFPRLAGQNATYIARQLADYKSGRRKSSQMQPMVAELSAADFAALGTFFASKPPRAHAVADAALAEQGKVLYEQPIAGNASMSCSRCHGSGGEGAEDQPRLAGQHAQYIENQLRQFNKRERTNDNATMQNIAARLSEAQMRALAAYLSGLK